MLYIVVIVDISLYMDIIALYMDIIALVAANKAPQIFAPRAFTVRSGEAFEIVLYANDSDGDVLTFMTSASPDSSESVDNHTQKYFLTLNRTSQNDNNLTFVVKVRRS